MYANDSMSPSCLSKCLIIINLSSELLQLIVAPWSFPKDPLLVLCSSWIMSLLCHSV